MAQGLSRHWKSPQGPDTLLFLRRIPSSVELQNTVWMVSVGISSSDPNLGPAGWVWELELSLNPRVASPQSCWTVGRFWLSCASTSSSVNGNSSNFIDSVELWVSSCEAEQLVCFQKLLAIVTVVVILCKVSGHLVNILCATGSLCSDGWQWVGFEYLSQNI